MGDDDNGVKYGIINELISRILMQDIHDEGFKEITISHISEEVGDINQELLYQIADESYNLTKLSVKNLTMTEEVNRVRLTNMVLEFLHIPDSPLTHLDVTYFSKGIEDILDALATTATPNLLSLKVGGIFMFGTENFDLLLEVL